MNHLSALLEYKPIKTGEIPTIPLYMDQVLSFLYDRMSPFRSDPSDKIMTKTMVNNYVKADLLPTPNKKKYTVEHIKRLIMIYHFKNVVSIKEIQHLFHLVESNQKKVELYDLFINLQNEEIRALKLNKSLEIEANETSLISTIRYLIRSDLCSRIAQIQLNPLEDN